MAQAPLVAPGVTPVGAHLSPGGKFTQLLNKLSDLETQRDREEDPISLSLPVSRCWPHARCEARMHCGWGYRRVEVPTLEPHSPTESQVPEPSWPSPPPFLPVSQGQSRKSGPTLLPSYPMPLLWEMQRGSLRFTASPQLIPGDAESAPTCLLLALLWAGPPLGRPWLVTFPSEAKVPAAASPDAAPAAPASTNPS